MLSCSWFRAVISARYDFRMQAMFRSSLPLIVLGGGGSCLIYVICACLCIVASNTYCAVFLLCLSCLVICVASFSLDCQSLLAPSVFSSV